MAQLLGRQVRVQLCQFGGRRHRTATRRRHAVARRSRRDRWADNEAVRLAAAVPLEMGDPSGRQHGSQVVCSIGHLTEPVGIGGGREGHPACGEPRE